MNARLEATSNALNAYLSQHADYVNLALGAIVMAVLIGFTSYMMEHRPWRRMDWFFIRKIKAWGRTREMRQKRRLEERILLEDAITDAVEKLVEKQKIGRDAADRAYRTIAHATGWNGLLPRRDPDTIKKAIITRLNYRTRDGKGLNDPVDLPDIKGVKLKKIGLQTR